MEKNRPSPPGIVLVGMMGSGKTRIGSGLAKRLNLPFFDADAEIEAGAGFTINDFFDRYGEEAFRQRERQVIGQILAGKRCVLATGGGAFMDEEIRNHIHRYAISIWLRTPIDILVERVSRRNTRPLLRGENIRETLICLAKERDPVYAQADLIIDSLDEPRRVMIDHIEAALKPLMSLSSSGSVKIGS